MTKVALPKKATRPVKTDPGLAWENIAKTIVCLGMFFIPLGVGWWTADRWESHKLIVLLLTASLGWLAYWTAILRRRTIAWTWTWLDWSALAVVGFVIISSLTSIRPWASVAGFNGQYGETLPAVASLVGLYLLIGRLFRGPHDQRLGWMSLLGGIVVASLIQVFQFSGFSPWLGSLPRQPFFSPISGSVTDLAIIAALVSAVALLSWPAARERWMKLLAAAGLTVGWLVVLFVGRPLGWAVFSLGMMLVVLTQAKVGTKANVRLIALAVALAALGMIAQLTNVASRSSLGSAADPRLDLKTSTAVAKTAWRHFPLFGSGPATWYYDFVAYRPTSFNASALWGARFTQAGNQWSHLAATTGTFGLFAWLVFLAAAIRWLWRRWQTDKSWLAGVSLLIGLTIVVSSFFSTWSLVLLVLFWSSLGLSRAAGESPAKNRPISLSAGLGFAVTVVLVLLWWYPAWRVYASQALTESARQAANRTEPLMRVENRLQSALRLDARNLNAAALLANAYDVELKINLQRGDSQQAQASARRVAEQLDRLIKIDPKNPVGYEVSNNILSDLAGVVADVEQQAQKNFQTLRRLEPANPIHDVGYGQTLMVSRAKITGQSNLTPIQQQQADALLVEALAAYDAALRKKPDYLQAHLSRLQAQIDDKRYTEALDELTPLLDQYPTVAVFWLERGTVLSQLNRPTEAVAAFEQALQLNPTDPAGYLAYADYYRRLQDKEKAQEVLRRGLKLLPNQTQLTKALQALQ